MDELNDMEAKVRLTSKLDRLLEKITIGYVQYQIWGSKSDKFVWGAINDRTIDLARKKKMYESLKQEGPQQAKNDTVIKILMKPSWFNNEVIKTIGGMDIMQVPLLKLTEEGLQAQKDKKLKLLEGLGRRGGVELWMQSMNNEMNGTNTRMKKISELKTLTPAHLIERTELEVQKSRLEVSLEEAQWWTFCILDQGESIMMQGLWFRIIVNDLCRSIGAVESAKAGGSDGAVGKERDAGNEA